MTNSQQSDTTYPSTGNSKESSRPATIETMLSVDFSTPLSGDARAETIKQMMEKHPSFGHVRWMNETVNKIQTTLRRTPGISGPASSEINGRLQEISQLIGTEIGQLVDALMNLQLDAEDTGKAISRMGIENNLSKASLEDQTQKVTDLKAELAAEKEKRHAVQTELKALRGDLQAFFAAFQASKDRSETHPGRDEVVKDLEDRFEKLQARLDGSQSNSSMSRTSSHDSISKQNSDRYPNYTRKSDLSGTLYEETSPPHAPHFDQPQGRPSTTFDRAPTSGLQRFMPLQAGPPRATSTRPLERQLQSPSWGGSMGASSRSVSMASAMVPSRSSFNRTPSRRGFQGQSFRPNVHESTPNSYGLSAHVPSRPGTAFMGQGRNAFPRPPTAMGRSPFRHQTHDSGGYEGAMIHQGRPLVQLSVSAVMAWQEQLVDFYDQVRHFAGAFASAPVSSYMLNELRTQDIWPVLLRTYNPLSARDAVSYITYHIQDENFKVHLVTRVIIDYMVNAVWTPEMWKGCDEQTDCALEELEMELTRTIGQPAHMRQHLLDAQAGIIDNVLKHSGPSSAFWKHKVEHIATMILNNFAPILNPRTNPNEAYRRLEYIASRAFDLSSKILTSRLTFDFRFPEVGSRFSAQSMTSLHPSDMEATEIQAKHWRVSMVVTPVVTCRNDTGNNISAHSVTLADVLCMQ